MRRQNKPILKLTALVAMALATGTAQRPGSVPLQDQAAQVVQMTGQVSVLRDSNPWALKAGDQIQVRQTIVTGPNGYAVFKVYDGSTFEVFPNSNVVFRANTGNWKDLLDLVLGRVRVQIQHLGGQPNPNNVHTPTAVISVRGTVFDVNVEEEDGTTLVQVEEGLVAVKHTKLTGGERMVAVGEYLRVFPNQPLARAVLDKGGVMQQAANIGRRALIEILQRRPIGGSGSGGASGSGQPLPGDKDSTKAPPPSNGGGAPGGGGPPAPPSAPGSGGGAPPPPPPPPGI